MKKELIKCESTKDYSISCVRFMAMCFIVACHVMQRDDFASDIAGAHIEWAFWLNVGVQMFLFISGFLYGKKDELHVVEFYKKVFPKILIDYYIFIFVMLLVIHWSPLMSIDKNGIVSLLTFSGTVSGLGHLWYIPTILFCYLLAPIYLEVINAIGKRSDIRFFIEAFLLMAVVHITVKHFFRAFTPAWINCFVIGMLYSRIELTQKKIFFNGIMIAVCTIIIPVQFRIDYYPHGDLPCFFASRYSHFQQYGHVFLGILLVILIRFIYKTGAKNKSHYIFDWSDRYSYDVYLVHHIFVQSAFGCVEFIDNRLIAIPLAVFITIIAAILLHVISSFVQEKSVIAYRKIPN